MESLALIKQVSRNKVTFFPAGSFGKDYVRRPLVLTYPESVNLEELPSSVVDIPLITNVIAAIWFSGKCYEIPEMDEDLYFSLKKIQTLFRRFFYNTSWDGELVPKQLVKSVSPIQGAKAAALYTGGLDSTTTMLRHLDENLTLISFNDIHETAAAFARSLGVERVTIRFNYFEFLQHHHLNKASIDITKWFWDTSMGLSWVGVTAPFLYAKGIPHLYFPSGFTWDSFLFPDGQTMRQPASPLIDENISPAGIRVTHDVFTMTRTDKVELIANFCAEHDIPIPQLTVCNQHKRSNTQYTHCNQCVKCFITMLDIFATGQDLREYGFTFSDEEFMAHFREWVDTLQIRRGGTYTALHDTQRYVKQHIETLPSDRRPFYEWLLSIDLWARVEDSGGRPPRPTPFQWSDYADIYPGVRDWVK